MARSKVYVQQGGGGDSVPNKKIKLLALIIAQLKSLFDVFAELVVVAAFEK